MAKNGRSSAAHILGTVLGVILTICLIPLILLNGLLIKSHLTYREGPPAVQGRAVFLSRESVPKKAKKGSLLVAVPSEDGKYREGEYIAFRNPDKGEITVRRIVAERHSMEDASTVYETERDEKGDNFFLSSRDIIGVCNFRLAPLGEAAIFLNSGLGIIIAVLLPLIWFILATRSKEKKPETVSDPPEPMVRKEDFNLDEEPPIRLGQHSNPGKWNSMAKDAELVKGRVLAETPPEAGEDPYEKQIEECREIFRKADRLEEKKPSSLKLDPERLKEAEMDEDRKKAIERLEKSKSVDLLKDEIPEPPVPAPKQEVPEPLKENPAEKAQEPEVKEEPVTEEIPEPLKAEEETPEPLRTEEREFPEGNDPLIDELSTVRDDFLAVHRETIKMLEELKAAEEAQLKRLMEQRDSALSSIESIREKENSEGERPVKVKPRRVYGYNKRGADDETEE